MDYGWDHDCFDRLDVALEKAVEALLPLIDVLKSLVDEIEKCDAEIAEHLRTFVWFGFIRRIAPNHKPMRVLTVRRRIVPP